MTPRTAEDWIRALALTPHPEGGHFRETHRSMEHLAADALPRRFGAGRSVSTAIVYLLRAGERSRFHRLRADEVWHHYDGGALELHQLVKSGAPCVRLGLDAGAGERPQVVIPGGTWFAAEPAAGVAFVLCGCTVAPGFDFADWELGLRGALLAEYRDARDVIERFTDEEA